MDPVAIDLILLGLTMIIFLAVIVLLYSVIRNRWLINAMSDNIELIKNDVSDSKDYITDVQLRIGDIEERSDKHEAILLDHEAKLK